MRWVFRFTKKPAAKGYGRPYGLECIGGEFLRNQADQTPGIAVVFNNIKTIDRNRAATRIYNATNGADQGCFAGPIGAQQRQYFTPVDIQINPF